MSKYEILYRRLHVQLRKLIAADSPAGINDIWAAWLRWAGRAKPHGYSILYV